MSELSTLGNILFFTFLGSVGALIGGIILLAKENFAIKVSHFLGSFAAGTLLGAAFFDLLPEAAHEAEESGVDVFLWCLLGVVLFFLVERFMHWFHHHDDYHKRQSEREEKTTIPLIIVSDTLHNFLDGVVIAATFLISVPLGVVTTLAVAAHEIPQEIGDFGLLLHKGMSRKKVLLVNLGSAAAAFAGAIITYFVGEQLIDQIPLFLAVTAGFFIYISLSDLIPEIHHESRKNHAILQTALFLTGIYVVYFSAGLLEHGH